MMDKEIENVCTWNRGHTVCAEEERRGRNEFAFLEIKNCSIWQRRELRGMEKVVMGRGTRIGILNFPTANWA